MWNLLIFSFNAVFYKIKNLLVVTSFPQKQLVEFALQFCGAVIITKCTYKMRQKVCISWLVVMLAAKFYFLCYHDNRHSKLNILIHLLQNQNIKLINSPSFKSNQLLFLEIKCRKERVVYALVGKVNGHQYFKSI